MLPRETKRSLHFEDIPLPTAASLLLREFCYPRFPFNWHYHPEMELMLIVKGHGLRFVGDSVEQFSAGDLCLLGENTPHCWVSDASVPAGARSLVLHFRPSLWGADFLRLPEARALRPLFEKAKRGLLARGTTRRVVSQLLLDMTRQPSGSWQRLNLLFSAVGQLADSNECVPLASAGYDQTQRVGTDVKLGKVLGFINDNLGPEMTQRTVASFAGMSPQAFSRFFKHALGKTFVVYANELKVRKACRSLLETDLSVTEVAYMAGFNNLSHFNEQFRRFKAMTPGAYRRRAVSVLGPDEPHSANNHFRVLK